MEAVPDDLVLVGNGPTATGPGPGWRMRPDLFAKCPHCGDLFSLDPSVTTQCSCGRLHKDHSAGRFGCYPDGDDAIEIYRRG